MSSDSDSPDSPVLVFGYANRKSQSAKKRKLFRPLPSKTLTDTPSPESSTSPGLKAESAHEPTDPSQGTSSSREPNLPPETPLLLSCDTPQWTHGNLDLDDNAISYASETVDHQSKLLDEELVEEPETENIRDTVHDSVMLGLKAESAHEATDPSPGTSQGTSSSREPNLPPETTLLLSCDTPQGTHDDLDLDDNAIPYASETVDHQSKLLDEELVGEPETENIPDTVDDSVMLDPNQSREVYLITYSQAVSEIIRDRKHFGELMAAQWPNVEYWTCSQEVHRHDGVHYHCALKLTQPLRWSGRRKKIKDDIGIDVDFLGFHTNYYDAFKYVTKQDVHYVQSPGHVDMTRYAPRTTAASRARHMRDHQPSAKSKPSSSGKARAQKPPRLDNAQVCEIITKNNIRSDRQLGAFATKLKKLGKDDLWRWFTNHAAKRQRLEVLQTAWTLAEAEDDEEREGIPRMELLRQALSWDHRYDPDLDKTCTGEWIPAAIEVLQKNNISVEWFTNRIRQTLKHGRSKKNNLMIVGGTNRAKSFLFMPMTYIFKCFSCPSDNKFNWIGAPEKEVIFLNDFRYSDNMMSWGIFLNFLEGASIHVSMPKSHFVQDQVWEKKQPIFATAEKKITRILHNQIDAGETAQMDKRWEYIYFNYRIPDDKIDYRIVSCHRCFAEFILNDIQDGE